VIFKDPKVDKFMLLLEGLVHLIFYQVLLIFIIEDVTSTLGYTFLMCIILHSFSRPFKGKCFGCLTYTWWTGVGENQNEIIVSLYA
jgi:hypothetical protein